MRRLLQISILLLSVLTGSLGAGALSEMLDGPCPCCPVTEATEANLDPCRAPRPTVPCELDSAPALGALSAPWRAIEARVLGQKAEPSPFPQPGPAFRPDPRRTAAARPRGKPEEPLARLAGRERLAMLSVYRI